MDTMNPVPNTYPPEANDFSILYQRVEASLGYHSEYLQDRPKAQVDWAKFGNSLGADFLSYVCQSGKADELLKEPPRVKHRNQTWLPVKQTKIKDTAELFVRSVCQVRNNIQHAGKVLEPEEKRSYDLLHGAFWILTEAVRKHPDSKHIFKWQQLEA